jgi:hypothetical protein
MQRNTNKRIMVSPPQPKLDPISKLTKGRSTGENKAQVVEGVPA